ncbi:DMT family transporter [Rugosimonospora acidiphila]|uniref:DMT family transporter n=1 Tax=Rugosimonospora acidiphila TaxID=556531 RepID=A0ABP9RTR4_9ACTN
MSRPKVPDRSPHPVEPHHYLSGCVLSALAGAVLAVQSRINGDFGHRVHDGVAVSFISFGSSLVFSALIMIGVAIRRRARAIVREVRTHRLPAWYYLGGIAGAYTILSQGEAVAALGVAVFTIAAVAGQSVSSLLVDRLGIGPAGRRSITGVRLVGAALAIVAVIASVSGELHGLRSIGLIVLPALAGIGTPFHQALNGRVRVASGSTMSATTINFLVGTVVLLPVFGIDIALRGLPSGSPTPWPAYLGGPLGVAFVAITITVVRYIGVLLLALATIVGQLVVAVILDEFAPEEGAHPGPGTFIGVALTIVSVVVVIAFRRRQPEPPAGASG